ncbi:flagellar hook-associated protein FlgK [Marinomonas sp. THO17]|uniref:flagellar hook-associated protein FlgK n=1 Tax=Marinomonas sp. THO17 TaxID=3149048 RepID=UPI00336BBEE5
MSSNLYSVGLSGLMSSNARINTTGQNTTNVDTEGYSRQRTDTVSSPVGGVVIRDTSRLVDNFVSQQVRTDTSKHSYYDAYLSMISTSDSLLAEDSISLNTYLNNAFDALQTANNDPTSASLRALTYSSLENLVQQYKVLSSIVSDQEGLIDEQLGSSLDDLNAITSEISNLNKAILKNESFSISPANELRDQQEVLAKKLSEYLDVKIQYNDDGLMSVQLANGQPLVMDKNTTELVVRPNALDPKKVDLMVNFGDYEVGLKTENLGGSLGGLIDYRSEFSTYSDRTLGQHAISMADAMNTQNKKGVDANGQLGQNLFTLGEIKVFSSIDNLDKAENISVKVADGQSSKVSMDTFELTRTDDDYFVIKTIDMNGKYIGQPITLDLDNLPKDSNGYFNIAELGLDLRLSDIDDIDYDDIFRFTPTEGAALNLSMFAKNGEALALGAPLAVNTSSNNLSDARISLSTVTNTNPNSSAFASDGSLYPSAPHQIYFTSPSSYVVRDASGVEIASVKNVTQYTRLLEQAGLAEEAGFDVSVSSKPKRGDEFTISTENLGVSDNFNGLALAALQTKDIVAGKATLMKAFSGYISYVGSKTAEVEGHADATRIVMEESVARRDRLSAVSLDEEAVNLLKYQQSYSASAQVVTAARTTFETLLGIMR